MGRFDMNDKDDLTYVLTVVFCATIIALWALVVFVKGLHFIGAI